VCGALRDRGIGDAGVEGARLGLKTATEYLDGARKFVGYQCQAGFAVESRALDDVEALLVDVVAAGANEIEGVDFDVIAKRDLHAEASRRGADEAELSQFTRRGAAARRVDVCRCPTRSSRSGKCALSRLHGRPPVSAAASGATSSGPRRQARLGREQK
jgi:hypothetical protein